MERSEVIESRLLHALQQAVLRPEVVDYTLKRLEAEIKEKLDNMSADLDALRRRKHTLEGEIKRLTDALASGNGSRVPGAVVGAINERESELRNISARLLEGSPDSIPAKLRDLRQFVIAKLGDLRTLLNSDIPTAKAEILRHVDRINLSPMEANGERFFFASGEWDLLGGYTSRKLVGAAGRS